MRVMVCPQHLGSALTTVWEGILWPPPGPTSLRTEGGRSFTVFKALCRLSTADVFTLPLPSTCRAAFHNCLCPLGSGDVVGAGAFAGAPFTDSWGASPLPPEPLWPPPDVAAVSPAARAHRSSSKLIGALETSP